MSTEREPKPRVSASGVVIAEDSVTSSRSVVLPDLPARWLDRLLVAQCELPVEHGEAAVARALLEAARGCLPNLVLGAVIVSPRGRELVALQEELCDASSSPRIFPTLAREQIIAIPDGGGSAIHAAADDGSLDDEASPALQLLQRAAFGLRAGLELARKHGRDDALRREVAQRESQLIQAEKLATLGRLAVGMVHELNNPLTSIIAYTDILTKQASARTPQNEHELEKLRRISESANRMLRFTRNLVQYARPIETRGPVVVSSVIETALGFCEHLLDSANATIERRYGAGVLPVRGVAEQLAQVFVNLFTNACHALPEQGGRLVVVTESVDDEYVRIAVEDNGHGMDAATMRQVFEPFFTTKTNGRGSGLGLSIVKSIVEQHEGTIDVESELSRGTRFVLTLPVALGDRASGDRASRV